MTWLALGLTVLSAFLHAGWNLIGKRQTPGFRFFVVATLLGSIPPALLVLPWQGRVLLQLTAADWGWIAVTGLSQCLYLAGLAGAYRSGLMAQCYPIIRALPVLMLALLVPLLLGGGWPAPKDWLGFALVSAGLLLLAGEGRVAWHWVILAAVGTTGYSLIDSHLITGFQQRQGLSPFAAGWLCLLLQSVSTWVWGLLGMLVWREDRPISVGAATTTGVMMFITYGLVLCAFALVTNIAYVVAFRQLSIPLGMAMAALFLGEQPARWHWYAVLPLLAGLFLLLWVV